MTRTLVLGGARSGKSTYAEGLLANRGPIDYVATAPNRPGDEEWRVRIEIHQQRRPANWRTLETIAIAQVLAEPGNPVLIDCCGLWLTSQLEIAGCWDEIPGARDQLKAKVDEFVSAWRDTSREVVAVSNEVGMGVVPATPSGRLFRDELGKLNMALANEADQVWLLVAGQPMRIR